AGGAGMSFRNWCSAALAAAALAALPGLAGPVVESAQPASAEPRMSAEDAMFETLVAEFAAQRGDTQGAIEIYQRMARELRDPHLARRAVELAIRSRSFAPALESASLLLELESDSTLAREIMAALLANDSSIDKARDTLAGILGRTGDRGAMLMQLPHLFAKFKDKAAVLEAIGQLAGRYADLPQAHHAVGVAALVAGDVAAAGREADRALELGPAWEPGAILKAEVLQRADPAAVGPFYRGFVERHPESLEVRMQYGRVLAGERKLAEAREQFREAGRLAPKDAQPAYAAGLLSLQLEEYGEATAAFTRALKLDYREPAAIYFGLGQASEGMRRYDEAIAWYQKVDSGDWVRAQLKIATLMAREQGLAAGRDYLRRIEPRTGDDRIRVIQVEAQLLRDAKAWRETYDMLSQAVAEYPDSFELLYDRAMAAERIDRLDVLEQDLRRVIQMKPDYAHAYNALGYTLAEKTDRLEEAKDLIEKAVKLSPDDPFILDSLGWVNFRLGRVDEALKHLQSAYAARPDPEIAAHLGEVLWKVGQRDQAQKIWREALTENPDHETLTSVMQKYRP
ncbi:MAG TPA: tetratricopeptide repeat protein, partial [Myxococcota bacterium]|nr:tetratricopeptide repeat protein [Myxococcota bacterium]